MSERGLRLTPVGRAIWVSGAAKFYKDGDGAGFVWRWWHPIAWLAAPLAVLASVLVHGIPETWRGRNEIGFGMKPWFKAHPERLKWISRPTQPHNGEQG